MHDKLMICVSQHQALFDKQNTNYKDDLKKHMAEYQISWALQRVSNVTLCSLLLNEVTSSDVC